MDFKTMDLLHNPVNQQWSRKTLAVRFIFQTREDAGQPDIQYSSM